MAINKKPETGEYNAAEDKLNPIYSGSRPESGLASGPGAEKEKSPGKVGFQGDWGKLMFEIHDTVMERTDSPAAAVAVLQQVIAGIEAVNTIQTMRQFDKIEKLAGMFGLKG